MGPESPPSSPYSKRKTDVRKFFDEIAKQVREKLYTCTGVLQFVSAEELLTLVHDCNHEIDTGIAPPTKSIVAGIEGLKEQRAEVSVLEKLR